MCIYDKKLSELAKNTADQKLISDIKDAVSFLNEEKLKLTETSKRNKHHLFVLKSDV